MIGHHRGPLPFPAVERQVHRGHEHAEGHVRRRLLAARIDRRNDLRQLRARFRFRHLGPAPKSTFPFLPILPPLRYPLALDELYSSFLVPSSHQSLLLDAPTASTFSDPTSLPPAARLSTCAFHSSRLLRSTTARRPSLNAGMGGTPP